MNLSVALEWISKQSIQEVEKVETRILNRLEEVRINPEHFPPDKYKSNNAGEYRALEIVSYRITFYYTDDEVRILHFRHVRQEPLNY